MSQRLLIAALLATTVPTWQPIAATNPTATAARMRLTISATVQLPDPCHEATIVPRSARDSYEVVARRNPRDAQSMCAMVVTTVVARASFEVRTMPSTIRLRALDRVFNVRVRRS